MSTDNNFVKKIYHFIVLFFLLAWVGSCSVGIYLEKWNVIFLGSFFCFLFIFFSLVANGIDKKEVIDTEKKD